MNEEPKDYEKKEKGQQFTPTDWDWVMFLSGEINTITTRFDTVWTTIIAIFMACMVLTIACLGILASDSDRTIYSVIIVIIIVIIGGFCYRLLWEYNKKKREAEDRVKLLEKCRNDIFDRLDDPNKILKCLFERCWKKK